MCAFMRYSAHGGDCAPRSERASCRGTARPDSGATRAVSFRRRQAHHYTREATLARAGDRTSEVAVGQAAPHAVWAEVGEAGAADRAVGVATGGTGIQPQRERVHAARTGFGPSFIDCQYSEARAPYTSGSSPATDAPARAERNRVPAMPGRVTQVGRRCFGDAGVCARQFRGDSSCSHQALLRDVRLHCAGGSTESPDRARAGRAGAVGACAGVEVLRPSATVSAVGDLRASRCGTGALDDGRLGRWEQPVAGAAGGSAAWYVTAADKLHADDTPVPVLAPGQGKTKTGRLWTYVRDDRPAGDTGAPAVWFAYSPDRKGEHPAQHLEKFHGTLQADAYAGFN